MENTPKIVYLQINPDAKDFKELSDVTWCEDEINKSDLAYVNIDLFGLPIKDFIEMHTENGILASELLKQRDELIECLQVLCDLRHIKDLDGKTPYYLEKQPLAWQKAKNLLTKTKHNE